MDGQQLGEWAAEMVELKERLAAAEAERDAAREWIRRHYEQWRACSPTACDMRAEMPWLAEEDTNDQPTR